ncbi:alternative ribosome rescue aminoacyl-tRNA hydrolase ArfB [Thiothrix nivea]|uniref:Class I peptide chain release factor n=1 Tax=Thiothrix nivea (strain ATCC 35100 / DSM 5205 / JP2) TaxID=870187 RepID=A0A656HKJ4_THINJ|nr:alternative ribosome rescue aminoacyl-tRNA hydrolase ArfB [Thiothrix nivea]EIJ36624.1 Class I peptide chain release factor [Thiothrix nivea DSM 5205]
MTETRLTGQPARAEAFNIRILPEEIDFQPIRAQGSGGQNVNKVSTAIHLRFDIRASSLPEIWKEKLLAYPDQRISSDGVIIIKAQTHNSQEKNRADALERLRQLIVDATKVQKKRKATRPTRSSQIKRVDSKKKRGTVKAGRGKVDY